MEHGFTQIADFPTREYNIAILDVFFTNCPLYEYTCKPLPGNSDHEIVYVTSAVDIEWQKPFSRKIYLWHKADFDHIKYLANSLADEFVSKQHQLRPFGMILKVTICSSCFSCVPSRIRSQ